MSYLVTAVLEDNREFTVKVCARVENSFNAVDAIVFRLANRVDPPISEEIAKEGWNILYLSCMHEEEGHESPLPLYEEEVQK